MSLSEVKRFIVNLVRKLSIQYFNKIKLNFFAKEDVFIFLSQIFFLLLKKTLNSQHTVCCIDNADHLSFILNAAMEAGEVGT